MVSLGHNVLTEGNMPHKGRGKVKHIVFDHHENKSSDHDLWKKILHIWKVYPLFQPEFCHICSKHILHMFEMWTITYGNILPQFLLINKGGKLRNISWITVKVLTLNMLGPSYPGLTRSIQWLLMPWLLAWPGHQHPGYWPCKIGRSLSSTRKGFNYLCHISMVEW